ncbi:lipopolysaccharide biosynthesis protein [Pedobacter cryoconitis]|uniref:Lipopolysaccharide biosynthesis protein n=1 Tax=Pedobacter cryoconitis TaxID=188932 RepID=A0A7X0MKT5_9SPHI|nr:lipopolysaccharide biosynthesis protein [Pedobacter cryoconitis]MBB6502396.1 hypothetical protein [Pedobacter cryoconitis]
MEDKISEHKQEIEEISLKELILKISEWYRYFLSKWIVILSFALLGAILGGAYAYIKKPVYIARTSFVLEDAGKGGAMGQYGALASMAGIDLGGSGGSGIFQGDNILELYKSRTMIEKTLLTDIEKNGKKQLLVDWYISINKLREKWNKNPKLKGIRFSPLQSDSPGATFNRVQDSILGVIVSDISLNYLLVFKPDKKLSIIKAEVRAKDEFFAKAFDEQIVKNVNDFYVQTKIKKSTENVAILQHKTDSVRAVMNGSIYTAAAVADATPNLNITRQVQRIAPVQRSQFNAEMNKAVLAELLKNLELSKMNLLREAPLIQVIDEPVFPLEIEKLGKLKGMIVGAFLFGFLTCVVLLGKKILTAVMA